MKRSAGSVMTSDSRHTRPNLAVSTVETWETHDSSTICGAPPLRNDRGRSHQPTPIPQRCRSRYPLWNRTVDHLLSEEVLCVARSVCSSQAWMAPAMLGPDSWDRFSNSGRSHRDDQNGPLHVSATVFGACSAGVRLGCLKRHQMRRKMPANREADARIRTADPFITSEVLYQLSYVGAPYRV
jgi:hypothetical protein